MNQISPINLGARPAHLPADADALAINRAAFENWQSGFGVLSLRGGKWHVRQGGNEETVTVAPAPGMAPVAVPMLPVVIVGVATPSAKSYYASGYNPASDSRPPDCFSIDGEKPDARAANKQNAICATCKHNQWGSATNSPSGRGKACPDRKRIAVVRDLNDEPLMLQLPPTSVPNLQDYINKLGRAQAAVNQVVTVMAFDTSKTAPTVTFEPQAWLDANQYARAVEIGASLSVRSMLEQEWGDDAPSNDNGQAAQIAQALGPKPAHLSAPSPMVATAHQVVAAKAAEQAMAAPIEVKPVPIAPAPAPEPAPGPAPSVVQGAPADLSSAIQALLNN